MFGIGGDPVGVDELHPRPQCRVHGRLRRGRLRLGRPRLSTWPTRNWVDPATQSRVHPGLRGARRPGSHGAPAGALLHRVLPDGYGHPGGGGAGVRTDGGDFVVGILSGASTSWRWSGSNPATATRVRGGQAAGGGRRLFVPPFEGDAVLYLRQERRPRARARRRSRGRPTSTPSGPSGTSGTPHTGPGRRCPGRLGPRRRRDGQGTGSGAGRAADPPGGARHGVALRDALELGDVTGVDLADDVIAEAQKKVPSAVSWPAISCGWTWDRAVRRGRHAGDRRARHRPAGLPGLGLPAAEPGGDPAITSQNRFVWERSRASSRGLRDPAAPATMPS